MQLSLILLWLVAAFFLAMGVVALWSPERIFSYFGVTSLPMDARNEVSAVYGGFGIAVAALLVGSRADPAWHQGVVLAIAVALLGMAAGRLVSRIKEGAIGFYPGLFLFVEISLATALGVSLWAQ